MLSAFHFTMDQYPRHHSHDWGLLVSEAAEGALVAA